MLMPNSFEQSKMKNMNMETIDMFIKETNHAELTHWVSMLRHLYFSYGIPNMPAGSMCHIHF